MVKKDREIDVNGCFSVGTTIQDLIQKRVSYNTKKELFQNQSL